MLGWIKRRMAKKEDPREQLAKHLGEFELPTFPAVANRVLGLLRDPNVALGDAGDALAEDPGLSAKVLNMANSSAFAVRHEVRSVGQAASLLGRSVLESVILSVVVGNTLPDPKIEGFDQKRFWQTSARRAAAAKGLAEMLHPRTKSESFTAALLGDMAVPLLGQAHGEKYSVVLQRWRAEGGDLATLERDTFGCDHATVAGWVAESWQFPTPLVNAIGAHHDGEPDDDVPVAVQLVAALGEGDPPEGVDVVVEAVSERFGVPGETVGAMLQASFVEAHDIAARMV